MFHWTIESHNFGQIYVFQFTFLWVLLYDFQVLVDTKSSILNNDDAEVVIDLTKEALGNPYTRF